LSSKVSDLQNRIKELNAELWPLVEELKTIRYNESYRKERGTLPTRFLLEGEVEKEEETKQVSIICKCPYDDCKGLISSKFRCLVDPTHRVCKSCWEPTPETDKLEEPKSSKVPKKKPTIKPRVTKPHVCNPNSIESVRAIKSDTKACPTCAARVFRTEGCNSMWCVACHVGFDYRTGAVLKDVHNPHLTEWRMKQGLDPLGRTQGVNLDGCGEVNASNFGDHLERATLYKNNNFTNTVVNIIDIYQNLTYRLRDADRYTPVHDDYFLGNYLTGQMDDKALAQALFRRERDKARREAKRQIYETMRTLLGERLGALRESLGKIKVKIWTKIQNSPSYTLLIFSKAESEVLGQQCYETFKSFIRECNKIRKFINESQESEMKALGGTRVETITTGWRWADNRYTKG